MPIYEKDNNIVQGGLDVLISQYQNRYRIEGVIKSILTEVQESEDAIYDVGNFFLVDNAVGIGLDYLGNIVGQARNGLDDDLYRTFIRARIGVNKSNGTPTDLMTVAEIIEEPNPEFPNQIFPTYIEVYPASVIIYLYGNLDSIALRSLKNQLLQAARAAGIALDVIDLDITDGNPFHFANTYNENDFSNGGFSSIHGSTGNPGLWSSVIISSI